MHSIVYLFFRRIGLVGAFFFFGISFVYSQSHTFEKINGLSQNTVFSMMKDRDGFLWIATGDGINRYDGVEMKQYGQGSGRPGFTLEGELVRTPIVEDREGHLWFSTDMALYKFDKRTDSFHLIRRNAGLGPLFPVLSADSSILLFNTSFDVCKVSEDLLAVESLENIEKPTSVSFLNPDTGSLLGNLLWFSGDPGLFSFNSKTHVWENPFSSSYARFCSVQNGKIYLGVENELHVYDPLTKSAQFLYKAATAIRILSAGTNGLIWFGDLNGNLYNYALPKQSTTFFGNINPSNATAFPLFSIFESDSETLWLGGDVAGLFRFQKGMGLFSSLETGKSTPQQIFTHAIHRTRNAELLVGTYKRGLFSIDLSTKSLNPTGIPLVDGSIRTFESVSLITSDAKGNEWLFGDTTLFFRSEKNRSFQRVPFTGLDHISLIPLRAFQLVSASNGWLLGTSIGIFEITEHPNNIISGSLVDYYSGTSIKSLFELPDRSILLGMEHELRWIRDREKWRSDSLLLNSGVNAITKNDVGDLFWLATNRGLAAWKNGVPVHFYPEFVALAGHKVYAVQKHNNQLWCSTNNGIVKADIQYSEKEPFPNLTFALFSEMDGLPASEFVTGAYNQDAAGNMYFGSISGPVWFHPDSIQQKSRTPKLVFTEILVNEKPADSLLGAAGIEKLNLMADQNQFYFKFRAVDIAQKPGIKYKYRLMNWDKDWITAGLENDARYSNVKPGNYVFEVQSTNDEGVWMEQSLSLPITISPPFWQTTWFISLSIVFVFGVVGGIVWLISENRYKDKLAELEKKRVLDEERLRISREMHDDIGAGLTRIAMMSDAIRLQNPQAKSDEIQGISESSRGLIQNMQEIIWTMNPENTRLDLFLAFLHEQLNRLCEYAPFETQFDFPDTVPARTVDSATLRQMLLLIKEITNNALKHSGATLYQLEVRVSETQILFTATDNGKGFDPNLTKRKSGLEGIKQRAKALNAQLNMQTAPGKGTIYTVDLPV